MNAPHAHPHTHAATPPRRHVLLFALVLTCAMLVIEALGGWWAGSLALLADAGHMLVDAGALLLAWAATVFAARPADARRSFGYARLEVLAGFVNALVQVLLVAWIVYEAVGRLLALSTIHIQSGVMLAVAAAGLLVAAVAAALLVRYLHWQWADPALSLLVSLLILRGAWRLLRRSSHILLEGVPEDLSPDEIRAALTASDPEIVEVHHLHVWQIASGSRMATLHARLREGGDAQRGLRAIQRVLRDRYAIRHVTVQIESRDCLDPEAGCAEAAPAHDHRHT